MTDPYMRMFWWMGHVGQGTVQRMIGAALELHPEYAAERARMAARMLLDATLRLGHTKKSQHHYWRMTPPTLSMRADGGGAFWRGGMSPDLIFQAQTQACTHFQFNMPAGKPVPPRWSIEGTAEDIPCLAHELKIGFESGAAEYAVAKLPSIQELTHPSALPITQLHRLTPFWSTSAGLGSSLIADVIQFKPDYGSTRYFIQLEEGVRETANKYQAVYCAAWRRERLCHYDPQKCTFQAKSQLPWQYALPLCLCSGELPKKSNGTSIYYGIPTNIAKCVLTRLGQDRFKPTVRWL